MLIAFADFNHGISRAHLGVDSILRNLFECSPHRSVFLNCGELEKAVYLVWVLDEVLDCDCSLIKAAKDLCCPSAVTIYGEKGHLKEVLAARVT